MVNVQLRMVCQFWTPVTVRILAPYKPSAEEQGDTRLFSANVRKLISNELRLPTVEQVTGLDISCAVPTCWPHIPAAAYVKHFPHSPLAPNCPHYNLRGGNGGVLWLERCDVRMECLI